VAIAVGMRNSEQLLQSGQASLEWHSQTLLAMAGSFQTALSDSSTLQMW